MKTKIVMNQDKIRVELDKIVVKGGGEGRGDLLEDFFANYFRQINVDE